MFANERYSHILSLLDKNGAVTVSQLMETFKVSIETVRRDLAYLEKCGRLKRVHGGAVSEVKMISFTKLENRIDDNIEKKRELADTALEFINDGEVIAIDAGSTAIEFAEKLHKKKVGIKVVTHSLEVFTILKGHVETIVTGGEYLPEDAAFYGYIALEALEKLCFSKAFIFPAAISIRNGICDYIPELVQIQQMYIKKADKVFVLADSSKFEKSAFVKTSDVNPKYTYISDSGLNNSIRGLYSENNVEIITKQRRGPI